MLVGAKDQFAVRRTPRWFFPHSNDAKVVMGHKSQRHRELINGRF